MENVEFQMRIFQFLYNNSSIGKMKNPDVFSKIIYFFC